RARVSAVGRANSRARQYTDHSGPAAKSKALQNPAHNRNRWSMGYRIRDPLRRAAVLHGQHHGVRRWQGCAGDAIFRRSVRSKCLALPLGRTDGKGSKSQVGRDELLNIFAYCRTDRRKLARPCTRLARLEKLESTSKRG